MLHVLDYVTKHVIVNVQNHVPLHVGADAETLVQRHVEIFVLVVVLYAILPVRLSVKIKQGFPV